MTYSALLQNVEHQTGLGPEQAEAAVLSGLSVLLRSLGPTVRGQLLAQLPTPLLVSLERFPIDQSLTDPVGELAQDRDVSLAVARELLQVVGGAVAETVDPSIVSTLLSALRPSLVPFIAPTPDRPSWQGRPPSGSGTTLATGRPGSRHPLSEAGPSRPGQSGSIAMETNPHGDRKLSSGAPTPQRRA